LSPDGTVAVFRSGSGRMQAVRVSDGQSLADGPRADRVLHLIVASDNQHALCVDGASMLTIWDLNRGTVLHTEQLGTALWAAASGDGRRAVVGMVTGAGVTLKLWNLLDGSPISAPVPLEISPMSVALSHRGDHVAVGLSDTHAQVWDLTG